MTAMPSTVTNALTEFSYRDRPVRVVLRNGEPWWVLNDVCDVLELRNARMIAARLDEDDVSQTYITDNLGRQQQTNIINESGLYNVILRSDKPETKRFKRWVTHEVLPSIRKTGSYAVSHQLPQSYVDALRALADEVERREKAEAQNVLMAPKAELYDILLTAENAQTMSEVAKAFGWGRNRLFRFLREKKILLPNNNPYQEYLDRGLFEVREVTTQRGDCRVNVTQTLVTAKGIDFIGQILHPEAKSGAIRLLKLRGQPAGVSLRTAVPCGQSCLPL